MTDGSRNGAARKPIIPPRGSGRRLGVLDVMAGAAIGCGIVVETGGVGDVPWWLYASAVGVLVLTSGIRTAFEKAKQRKRAG